MVVFPDLHALQDLLVPQVPAHQALVHMEAFLMAAQI
jgi:hypothetical protein